MKFFKPEDFNSFTSCYERELIANSANAKLERKGKVVYAFDKTESFSDKFQGGETHQALLINIKTIEKCMHDLNKIRQMNWIEPKEGFNPGLRVIDEVIYKCECGAEVKPKEFEEIK